MTISVGDPFAAFTQMNKIKGSHTIQVTYFATFNESLDQIKLQPEDHSEYGWYAANEISKITTKVRIKKFKPCAKVLQFSPASRPDSTKFSFRHTSDCFPMAIIIALFCYTYAYA